MLSPTSQNYATQDWRAYFNVGVKIGDLLSFYVWSVPPWVIGLAYARVNLKRGVVALPLVVSAYILASFLLIPIFVRLGFVISSLAIFLVTALTLATIVRRVGE